MNEYEASLSRTVTNGKRISCDMCTVSVYAENEDEARQIISEEEPDFRIGKIVLIGSVDD